jgi:hypothetical protein
VRLRRKLVSGQVWVSNTRAYQVAPEARTILAAILTAARTSLHQINQLQKAAA